MSGRIARHAGYFVNWRLGRWVILERKSRVFLELLLPQLYGLLRLKNSKRFKSACSSFRNRVEELTEVLAEHGTDGAKEVGPVRWGSEAQATHCREGEAGHNIFLKGNMGVTQGTQTISTQLQGIACRAAKLWAKRGVVWFPIW